MAIDDKEKRVAVMGVGRPWMRAVEPSSDLDEEWRVSVGNAYGGNAIGAAVVVAAVLRLIKSVSRSVSRAVNYDPREYPQ